MLEDSNAQSGLVHALILDGRGGARFVARADLDRLALLPEESIWMHWDRGHPQTREWLRRASGLNEFACDLLLEENTRPRLVPLPEEQFLLFLRGVNLNPDAAPEDMVSVRIFAEAQRVISLRLRPLRATEELIGLFAGGKGPKTASELVLYLSQALTSRIQTLVTELTDDLDNEEDRIDADERYAPEHGEMLQIRRRAAGLRRFLAPQREIFSQLSRLRFSWFVEDDADYWNELQNSLTRDLEELELARERVSLVLESEDRRLSERMNRTMYRFGIITGIFLPLSFLTGLLGINVGGIPGAENPNGFLIACVILIVLGVGQIWLFRRLRWL